MSTDYQQLYLTDTTILAKTMVIKSEVSADLINSYLTLKHGVSAVDLSDPTSWKYYLNICGEYHPLDTVMTVISLDNLEVIEFTKDNLEIHTATAAAYGYGSRFYYSLVSKYPEQEQLILGILYPADLMTAINSDDGTILTYPTGLVEDQEITLIEELQEWLYLLMSRWDVKAYRITDSLYPVAQLGIMYLQLPVKLLNLRVKRCKTNEAHSFHIRMYLASHSGLDKYFDYMTLKQALFLYRNIDYIEHHIGRQSTFNWLMDKILTDRHVPLAEYQARLEDIFDNTYDPSYRFKKIPLNTDYNTPNKDFFPLEELLDKEKILAIENVDYINYNAEDIDRQIKHSASSILLTKDLESSMIDFTGNEIEPLSEVLFNHWGWLASNNLYRVAVNFKDPRTSEIQTLFSDDAFLYWIYILMMSIGAPITNVPDFISLAVQKLTLPTVEEINSVADNKLMGDQVIARWLLQNQPRISPCFSVSSFNRLGRSIFDAKQRQWYLRSRTEHMYERGYVENMGYQFYCDAPITFADSGQPFNTWLRSKSLPIITYTHDECVELMTNIFNAATGYTTDPTKIVKNIQRAMLAIMAQLSSYSIQFIQEINSSPIRPIAWAAIRLGNAYGILKDENLIHNDILVLDTSAKHYDGVQIEVDRFENAEILTHMTYVFDMEQKISVTHNGQNKQHFDLYFDAPKYRANYAGYNPAISDKTLFVGYEYFMSLTPEQRSKTVDIYSSPVVKLQDVTALTDIGDVIVYDTLNPMTYVSLSSNILDLDQE